MKCLYAEEMRRADQAAIDMGISAIVLMENAGRAVFEQIRKRWSRGSIERIIMLAGKGNNGGDGFVVARHLWNSGYDVSVYLLGRTSDVRDHALTNLNVLINMGVPISMILDESDLEVLKKEIASRRSYLCVDAIFGTGLTKEVQGIYRQVIECMNDSTMPVVAIDIPSGLDADTGFPLGIAVRATLTVTFAYPKVGCVLASGMQYVGELVVADISIPKAIEQDMWKVSLLDVSILEHVPVRPPEAHKGDFGRVAIFAGSPGFTGAACLASQAALRTGAGLVTLGIPSDLNPIMEVKLTEVMTWPLGERGCQIFHPAMIEEALRLTERSDALIMGPGIGTSPETTEFVLAIIGGCTCPLVLDADALNILSQLGVRLTVPAVMTPHPGEMSRLLGTSIGEIERDRIGTARQCATEYNAVVVLKGFRTVIASPEGDIAINPTGSNSMASGGMGDILAGILGTFLAQGLPPLDTACLGVYLHGLASDRVAKTKARGQIASDLLEEIPHLIREYGDLRVYQ